MPGRRTPLQPSSGLRFGRVLCGVLASMIVGEGFVVPSITLRSTTATSRFSRQLTAERTPAATMGTGLPPDSNMDDPFANEQPVIPDKVGPAALQKRIDSVARNNKNTGNEVGWPTTNGLGHRAAAAAAAARPALPRAAWVLIFNQGSQTTDGGRDASAARQQQGLYCLWSRGVNSAVAFEERDGALRYAFKLKARGLGVPSPTLMTMADLQCFCNNHGFGIWMVPANVVPEVPKKTKKDLGFDPTAAKKDAALERGAGGWGGAGARGGIPFPPFLFTPSPSSTSSSASASSSSASASADDGSVLTPEDVRKWRADFERLYAQEYFD